MDVPGFGFTPPAPPLGDLTSPEIFINQNTHHPGTDGSKQHSVVLPQAGATFSRVSHETNGRIGEFFPGHVQVSQGGSFSNGAQGLLHAQDTWNKPSRLQHTHPRFWSGHCLKWSAMLYCILSSVFLAVNLYNLATIQDGVQVPRVIHRAHQNYSDLSDMSTAMHYARIIGLQPLPEFFPFLIQQQKSDRAPLRDDVTACLWIDDETSLTTLSAWEEIWNGPISIVLLSKAPSSPALYRLLYQQAANLSFPLISIHVLHMSATSQISNNLYLNLARLFSTTNEVVLFPSSDAFVLPWNIHRLATQAPPGPFFLYLDSSPPSSPMKLPRDHKHWCTERYFPSNSRQSDWQECLWQLWLEGEGNIRVFNVSQILSARVRLPRPEITRRLQRQFRAESCEMSVKQGEAVYGRNSPRAVRRKQICSIIP